MSRVKKIEVPEFLKRTDNVVEEPKISKKAKRELYERGIIEPTADDIKKLKGERTRLRSHLVNRYHKLYPEVGIQFVVPNSYLEDPIENYYCLEREEMIERMLTSSDCYAILTFRENKFKLLNAYEAYKASSHYLQENRGRKISIYNNPNSKLRLFHALDVFELYRKNPNNRYRTLKN